MKIYQESDVSRDSWIALTAVFWRERMGLLDDFQAIDGIDVHEIETMRKGIRISCKMSFLPKMESFPATILLVRPRFSSIQDFTPHKLESATIQSACVEADESLSIEIG
jgi:hypothetical protein